MDASGHVGGDNCGKGINLEEGVPGIGGQLRG